MCDVFRMPILEVPGFEADDVIGTLARQAVEQGLRVVVVSGDKDLLQLVSDDVLVLNPGREGMGATLYDRKTVEEKWGVPPERVVDVLALVGDAVDNIPGVPGIGDKGARDLVREFGPVEAVLENADKVKRAAYREGLKNHREAALLSKRLATLRTDVPIALDFETLKRQEPDREAAHALFKELEFQALAKEFAPEASPAAETAHRLVMRMEEVDALVAGARKTGRLSLGAVVTSSEPMKAHLLGIAFAHSPGSAAYVPLGHSKIDLPDSLPADAVIAKLKPVLEDPAVRKLSAHAKRDLLVLGRRGIRLAGLGFDAIVASYLINPGRRSYPLDDLAFEFLGERHGSGTDGVSGHDASADATAKTAAGEADLVLRLDESVNRRLEEEGLATIYQTMELPLIEVLADMERAGVKIDRVLLASMSRDMERQLATLTRDIHVLAKGEFNINSPIQLREVLFDRLGLKSGKKTAKTRAASTAEDVLEELARHHELPRKILEYRRSRSSSPPTSTRCPSSSTRRPAASTRPSTRRWPPPAASPPRTRTCRTSPSGPRRGGASARPSWPSPATCSCPPTTARSSFGSWPTSRRTRPSSTPSAAARTCTTAPRARSSGRSPRCPPDEQRRVSKMVNYALLYGKTAFTLAKDIGVSKKEAETFIEAYFARYPSVRRFIDDTIVKARETGHVRTLLGRLRRLPDLRAKNFQVRMEAERQAMNTPVQGSAADLIKKAMIDLHRELRRRQMRSRLILQIHDELLLEVPEAEAETARALVKEVMEGALQLDVPLVADASVGRNWAEVH